jgi:hypothetical protein
MEKNKTGKYLKYAIGEIILVVIGILIALQINNWNEHLKDRNTERQILNSILIDLKSNEKILNETEPTIDKQINHTKFFLELMEEEPIVSDSTFNKVKKFMGSSTNVADIHLNLLGIEGIINTKIELITNDSIKSALIKYPAAFEGYKEEENVMMDLRNNRIRPRLKDFVFLENIASGSKKFRSNIRELLSDRTYANDMTDRKWVSGYWKKDFETLRNHGRILIKLIEKELNRN